MPTTILTFALGIIIGFAIAKLTTKKQSSFAKATDARTGIGKSTQAQITAKEENPPTL